MFSDEHTEMDIHTGVMNRQKIAEFLDRRSRRGRSTTPTSGPPDERRGGSGAAGRGRARTASIERFAQQASGQVGAVLHQAQPGGAAKARITIIRDGLKREIAFSREQPSILDAASAAGEVPFSCTFGRVRHLPRQAGGRQGAHGAQRWTRSGAAGYVLTCQAHPSPSAWFSFDER